jgi:IS5 family transposase
MIRMLIIGYCYGIRSERRLCEEFHLNPAYRWFCHLSLSDKVPDHSTFSKNRHGRFRDSDAFRHLFESVLRRCMEQDWSVAKDLRLMPASSKPMRNANVPYLAHAHSTGVIQPRQPVRYGNIWPLWMQPMRL